MRFGGDPLSEDGLEGGETLPQALTLNTYKPTLRNKSYYVAEYSLVDVLESTFIHACKILVCPDRKSTRLNSSHSGESRMPSSA